MKENFRFKDIVDSQVQAKATCTDLGTIVISDDNLTLLKHLAIFITS